MFVSLLPAKLITKPAAVALYAVLLTPNYSLSQSPGERVALVIGNSKYSEVQALRSPSRDADEFARVLAQKLKFKKENIRVRKDLTFEETVHEVKDFQNKSKGASLAVVYYSGHGIAFNDANYLAPVDVPLNLEMKNDDSDPVLHLDEVQRAVASADVGLIFWDACRTNDVETSVDSSAHSKQTAATRGLIPAVRTAASTNAIGTFIAFSTNPFSPAYEGNDGKLSPFTKALIGRISTQVSFIEMMSMVSVDVAKATKGFKRPQEPEIRFPKMTPARCEIRLG